MNMLPHATNDRSPTHVAQAVALMLTCFVLVGCKKSETETNESNPATNGSSAQTDAQKDEPVEDLKLAEGEVLRHAVFFTFKKESTEEQVQEVVDAFRALPTKIPEIIDFEWGVNNSPEEKNDGFTHCFLLTFADAKGRKVYLPHKEHKAFGDVLRPHMADVFVIDYVGKKQKKALEKELKHAVFFKFKDDADDESVQKVERAFATLPEMISDIKAFEWGRNNSPEKHDDGFTHCFMVTFDSEKGRENYLPHDDHMAFVAVLKPHLDKVRVLDYWAQH